MSWDDYDRLRRVPAGVDPSFAEHIGRPLTAVPDPCGGHENWAEHFKEPLRGRWPARRLVTEICQTQMYTSGAYRADVPAMRRRADIGAVLARHQTKRHADPDDDDPRNTGTRAYFPFKPYCAVCGRDTPRSRLRRRHHRDHLHLPCGARVGPLPIAQVREAGLEGRLADALGLRAGDFEPAGVDHASPGSSFTVGHEW